MYKPALRTALLVLVAHSPTFVNPARADGWSITPFAGGAFEQRRRGGIDDSAVAVGIAGGYGWSQSASVEGELTYIPDLFRDHGRRSILNVSSVFLYDLRSTGWQPFLAAGVGFGQTRFTPPEIQPPPRFVNPPLRGPSISLGGGVKIPLRRRAELRTDVRYVAIRDVPDDIRDFWRFSGGLTFVLSP